MTGGQFEQIFAQRVGRRPEPEPSWAPAWTGPPADELGECVPLSLVVARSERAVVAVRSATAYSTGVSFDVVAAARGLSKRETHRLFHEQHAAGDEEEVPGAFLRIGFELSDGRRASNLPLDQIPFDPAVEPDRPVLSSYAGGVGSADRDRVDLRHGFWLWPVPPPGSLRLYAEWPALDMPLATVDLDADSLRAAAERSLALWTS